MRASQAMELLRLVIEQEGDIEIKVSSEMPNNYSNSVIESGLGRPWGHGQKIRSTVKGGTYTIVIPMLTTIHEFQEFGERTVFPHGINDRNYKG